MNNFTVIIIFIVFTVIGLAFIPLQSVQLNPSDGGFSISVSYSWYNASGRIIENQVTAPLESAIGMLTDVEKINSTSADGSGNISVTFNKNARPDVIRFQVASVIRRLYPGLPDGVSYPELYVNSPNDDANRPFLVWTLNAPVAPPEIQRYAQDYLSPALSEIRGVYKVDVRGANPYEWIIEYDDRKTDACAISRQQIANSVADYFATTDLGLIINMNALGDTLLNNIRIENLRNQNVDWSKIPVARHGNRVIYLTDIAVVSRRVKAVSSYYRINGLNSITISVFSVKGANQLQLSAHIIDRLKHINGTLPAGFVLSESYNATKYIEDELNKIIVRTALTVLILLLFVFLVSGKLRYLAFIVASLIVNMSLAFCLYYLLGIEIHLYSLAGITVSLGMMLDCSIIMIDHLRHRGDKRVFLALLASTLTTMASLSVIYFLPDKQKLDLLDFAQVIIINLGLSLCIALFFIPALYALLPFRIKAYKNRKRILSFIRFRRMPIYSNRFYVAFIRFAVRFRGAFFVAGVFGFGLPVFWLPANIEGEAVYAQIYNKTFGNPIYIEKVKPISDKILGGTLRLFTNYVFESSYYSKPQETVLYVNALMPDATTVDQTNDVFLRLENFLSRYGGVSQYISDIDKGYGEMSIHFKKGYERSMLPSSLLSDLIAYSLNFDGIEWNVYGVGDGFSNAKGNNAPIKYQTRIYGFNYDELTRHAEELRKRFLEHPRVHKAEVLGKDVYREKPRFEYRLNLQKEMFALKNISPDENYRKISGLSGNSLGVATYFYNKSLENVNIQLGGSQKFNKWNLYNSPVDKQKLRNMATLEKNIVYGNIDKENQQYVKSVCFDYVGSDKFGRQFLDKIVAQANHDLPLGYRVEVRDNYYWFFQNQKISYAYILLVLVIMYFLCSILFESLWQPLALIAMVPLSFIGVFLTFYIFDINFDQGGYAAFVLLCGITVNSALYIINQRNNLATDVRMKRRGSLRLYLKAYNTKIVPILLTILSTILGFIPFLTGGQNEAFWYALAAGTIGGLSFSIVVIYVYLPLFFISKKNNCKKMHMKPLSNLE